MVDFSKRDDVKRWLDTVRPAERRRNVATALAARAALRILPLVGSVLGDRPRKQDEHLSSIILPMFRAVALSWAAARYPDRAKALAPAATLSAAAINVARATGGSEVFRDAAKAIAAAVSAANTASTAFAAFAADASRDAATAAANLATTSSNTSRAAASVVFAAFAADADAINSGSSGNDLLSLPLWLGGTPSWAASAWQQLKGALLSANQDWEVWADWYDSRLAGDGGRRPVEALEIARVQIEDAMWRDGPAVVNAEIKRLIDLHAPTPAHAIPETEPGPLLEVGAQGLVLTPPSVPGTFDQTLQSALHERLKRQCSVLTGATRQVGNTHPHLMTIVAEYADLIAQPLQTIDVAALWAVGTGLLALSDAFKRLPQAGVMSEPLEPMHLALLQQVAAIHGAFIHGFPLGRELTERADHSYLTPQILQSILSPARTLLNRWRHATKMVETRTREFIAAIEEGAIEPSWQGSRAGYSAYVVTRNALIGIGKLLLHANSLAATVVGATVVTAVDPNLGEQMRLWIPFVLDQSQTILSFSEPFPELKIWLSSIIDALERDEAFRKK